MGSGTLWTESPSALVGKIIFPWVKEATSRTLLCGLSKMGSGTGRSQRKEFNQAWTWPWELLKSWGWQNSCQWTILLRTGPHLAGRARVERGEVGHRVRRGRTGSAKVCARFLSPAMGMPQGPQEGWVVALRSPLNTHTCRSAPGCSELSLRRTVSQGVMELEQPSQDACASAGSPTPCWPDHVHVAGDLAWAWGKAGLLALGSWCVKPSPGPRPILGSPSPSNWSRPRLSLLPCQGQELFLPFLSRISLKGWSRWFQWGEPLMPQNLWTTVGLASEQPQGTLGHWCLPLDWPRACTDAQRRSKWDRRKGHPSTGGETIYFYFIPPFMINYFKIKLPR